MKRLLLLAIWSSAPLCGALAQQASEPLPALGADLAQTTVSGISSGGFMAAQLATAYSSRFRGVGIVAAGPFYCAGTYRALASLENAVDTCMNPLSRAVAASGEISLKNARAFAADGKIDPVDNLQRQRVYVFSGGNDTTVKTIVAEQAVQYYRLAGVPPQDIKYVWNREAGHAFATDDQDDLPCAATGAPFINNCGFKQSHELLRHLYPQRTAAANDGAARGRLIRFDQRAFVRAERTSMDDQAYVYVPDDCRAGGCAVHVALHGCRQGAREIGPRFYGHVGYNDYADTNRIIVLYPQVWRSDGIPVNPRGCWDFWGYSNGSQPNWTFATRQAPQMQAIVAMVERLGARP